MCTSNHIFKNIFTSQWNGVFQSNDGHVSGQSVGVPVGVDGVIRWSFADLARFVLVDIMGSKGDFKGSGTIGAVSSSQDVGRVDHGATAEVETVNGDGHLPILIKRWGFLIVPFTTSVTMYWPREFTRNGFRTTDNFILVSSYLGTAES